MPQCSYGFKNKIYYINRRLDKPIYERGHNSSLLFHSSLPKALSSASVEGVFSLHLSKYLPVTPFTSGDEARYTEVLAPCSTLMPARVASDHTKEEYQV